MGIECDRCMNDIHRSEEHYEMDGGDDIWCESCHKDINEWRLALIAFGCADLMTDGVCECHRNKCPGCGERIPGCIYINKIGGARCPVCAHVLELQIAKLECSDEDCALCRLKEYRKQIDGYLIAWGDTEHQIKFTAQR